MTLSIAPGDWVQLPEAPDWGVGQVQSVNGDRVTINFEHAGKRLVNASVAVLVKATAPTILDAG